MPTAKKAPVKKAAVPKAQIKAEAPAWNTIHIFGYGESQVIGIKTNGKVPNDSLKNLAPLLAHLAEKQQKGTKIGADGLHALNIFNGRSVDFRPASEKNKAQHFEWNDVNATIINKLADELLNKVPEQTGPQKFIDTLRKKSTPISKKNLSGKANNRKNSL